MVANTGRASQTVTRYPRKEPTLATAAAKSMAPNTSIRGAGAKQDTKTDSPSPRRWPSGPYVRVAVRPVASRPRASSRTASSSRWLPSPPDSSAVQTTR